MDVDGKPYRTIWATDDGRVQAIDQRLLPGRFEILTLDSPQQAAEAIRDMAVRGAPLIGAAAAYGLSLGAKQDPSDAGLAAACQQLANARPTGRNLVWALDRVMAVLDPVEPSRRAHAAFEEAARICDEDVAINRAIGEHGIGLITEIAERAGDRPVQVMTHCNAGWLATVDRGTAMAPVYEAQERGVPLHVWVSETRPRNQGSALTAWELEQQGIPYTVIVDSAAGHVMQRGDVDLVLVGTDRTIASGDVANKVGTYLKALAARANEVPFYVAAPSPSIDWQTTDASAIPIEERSADEVAPGAPAANPAFDVTPAGLVTAILTERGVAEPSATGLARLFPEHA